MSASVFPMLGTTPLLGRTIAAGDEAAGRDAVMLLSYATWHRCFGGDPAVVGRTVTLSSVLGRRTQREYAVIGVMPGAFEFPTSHVQFWIPLYVASPGDAPVRGPLLARLGDGVTREAAADEIAPVVRELRQHGPGVRYELVREQDEVVAPVRPALLVLTVGMLFGLTPLDMTTFVAVSLLFAVVAAAASSVPARRAARVDPLTALRCE